MGAMLSSPWAVSGVFLVPACGSCIVEPCIFCICNMKSQAFEVYSFSAFLFDLYTLLLYCVCTNCESFKSNQNQLLEKVDFPVRFSGQAIENCMHNKITLKR